MHFGGIFTGIYKSTVSNPSLGSNPNQENGIKTYDNKSEYLQLHQITNIKDFENSNLKSGINFG